MANKVQIQTLVTQWQEQQLQGKTLTLAELCPAAGEEVRQGVGARLQAIAAKTQDLYASLKACPTPVASQATGDAAPEKPELQPGQEPVPGYRLVQRRGKGGFGEVWEALAPGDVPVALKFIELIGPAAVVEKRALELVRKLRHPHLLAMFATWQEKQYLIIAMELADRTVMERFEEVARDGLRGIPRDELLQYFHEAAEALDYLNKPRHFLGGPKPVGIQHCDIKPQNLLLVSECIKVADFGLAQIFDPELNLEVVKGLTPAYAPPERFREQTSKHSDQYSLAVSYCLLRGGRLPFNGSTYQLMQGHLFEPPDLSMVSPEEQPILARALAKKPEDRWSNCREFVKELARMPEVSSLLESRVERVTGGNLSTVEHVAAPPQPIRLPEVPSAFPDVGTIAGQTDTLRVGQEPVPGFKLEALLGKGSIGEVWKARGPCGFCYLAMKFLRRCPGDPEAGQQALDLVKRIQHPHLLSVIGTWQVGSFCILGMELANRSLSQYWHIQHSVGHSGVSASELLDYLSQAAEGIDYLHNTLGILHRHIKPQNLLLVGTTVKVADFGMAEILKANGIDDNEMISPTYAAPEVFNGRFLPSSDQYSLAIVYQRAFAKGLL
jgi:serine/threonine protein kinase